MKVTVALPLWKAENIVYLQLEALSRQVTDVEWELIAMECESDACGEIIDLYRNRLEKAGCARVHHEVNEDRVPLGEKWRRIAKMASSPCYILAAADNYSPLDRVQRAHEIINEQDFDWTDTSRGVFYDIPTGSQGTWTRTHYNRTGLWMATKTEYIRGLKGKPPERNIDGWIHGQMGEISWHKDTERKGVHTDGANTISHSRRGMYVDKIRRPFIRPRQDAADIIPTSVMNILRIARVAA